MSCELGDQSVITATLPLYRHSFLPSPRIPVYADQLSRLMYSAGAYAHF